MKNFNSKVTAMFALRHFLMVGLDITQKHIPKDFLPHLAATQGDMRLKKFIIHVVDLTAPYCLGWKPNLKFYERSKGRERLEEVCAYIHSKHPDHILLGDDKDGDIGNTNTEQLDYFVNELKLDAFTLNPLMGYEDSMDKYLSDSGKAGIILCLTSNKGAGDILRATLAMGYKLYEYIASCCQHKASWNKDGNMHLVVGATNTVEEVARIRELAGDDAIFLMPGFGAQGGDPRVIQAARNSKGEGFFGVVARDIIAPTLQSDETYDEAVVRQCNFYKELFARDPMPAS